MDYSPARLFYVVTPTAVPYGEEAENAAGVSLMLTVTNNTGGLVKVRQIAFAVPTGPGSTDLASRAPFTVSPGKGVDWTAACDAAGVITVRPKPPSAGLRDGGSLAFFADLTVNQWPGTSVIGVWEQTDEIRRWDLFVTKQPPGLAVTRFQANPIQLRPGEDSVLSWSTTGAGAVTLSHDGTNESVETSGDKRITPRTTTLYSLTAFGQSATTHQQLTVHVPQVAIHSFAADPPDIPTDGESTLSWFVTNAERAFIRASGTSPDPGEVNPHEGSLIVRPKDLSTTYTLTAAGFGNSLQATAIVDLLPSIGFFTASPSQLPRGGGPDLKSVLRWKVRNGVDLSISPGIGEVGDEGSLPVKPAETTEYVLTGKRIPATAADIVVAGGLTFLRVRTYAPGSRVSGVVDWESAGEAEVRVKIDGQEWRSVPRKGWIAAGFGSVVTIRTEAAGWVNEAVLQCGVRISTDGGDDGDSADPSYEAVTCAVRCPYGISASGAEAALTWTAERPVDVAVHSGNEHRRGSGRDGSFRFSVGSGLTDVWKLEARNQTWFVKTVRPVTPTWSADSAHQPTR